MNNTTRVKCLPIALNAIGLFFIFGIYPMMRWTWPSGWKWIAPYQEYQLILLAIYATLGICLLFAARNLAANIGLIWFTIWLNLVCGTIMLLMVVGDQTGKQNLIGNIPVQYLISGVLWYLLPRHKKCPS
ncbi:DUF6632 domain-containing protein [Microbulbifer spongiae]|uniref:Uncharacterized protein n=1 Tax=Microbulbifer spongiae TaxID=2944933 RepID=A0ABY9E5S4_9GAMM|nr:DUF6632 domain-containing protein [Microbulbifer sp. MI-G]WKD48369.1 hypothetical protein M8T91_10520 [Microbulbifer sp. MI-G]